MFKDTTLGSGGESGDSLVERSLPTPKIRGSNPFNDIIEQYSTKCSIENTIVKEKSPAMAHLFEKGHRINLKS